MRVSIVCVAAAAIWAASVSKVLADFPHQQDLAPGVRVIGFADQYRSANCGWIETADAVVLVDLPRGVAVGELLDAAAKATGKRVTTLILTHAAALDAPVIAEVQRRGVKRVCLSPATHKTLAATSGTETTPLRNLEPLAQKTAIGDARMPIEFLPLDECADDGAAAVFLSDRKILWAGPLVFHGPRVPLARTHTESWIAALRWLADLHAEQVVPGFGSWGDAQLLARQRRFLTELRRQVGYFIAQGRPHDDLQSEIRLVPDYLVWMPYDTPLAEDVEHIYQELTVPRAPFDGRTPSIDASPPHALVLVGDLPHEPGHIEKGLRPVFDAAGVVPHFTVDVRALSAENLAHVRLLVILRDGLQRPKAAGAADYVWMTREQEQAVVDFVHRGGGFLNLHNSMGLYPEDGPYLRLVGGRYIGHGPLERFRVEVVDRQHPITRGVEDFSVADEQHTPPCDETKVHVLLRNRSDDGKTAAAGWVYEPGKGRLCHLANGHTRESLLHPMYQRLMHNAVRWCLRDDRPATGK